MDSSPRDHQIMHVHQSHFKWPRSESSPSATWHHEERLSSSTGISRDHDQTATMKPISFSSWRRMDHQIFIKADNRDLRLTRRLVGTVRSSSDDQDALRSSSHLGDAWTSLERPISIKSRIPSNGGEDSWKKLTIVARSNRDRSAIEPRSRLLQCGIKDDPSH